MTSENLEHFERPARRFGDSRGFGSPNGWIRAHGGRLDDLVHRGRHEDDEIAQRHLRCERFERRCRCGRRRVDEHVVDRMHHALVDQNDTGPRREHAMKRVDTHLGDDAAQARRGPDR